MAEFQADDLKEKLATLRKEGEERAAERLAEKSHLPYADLSKKPISLEAVRVVPEGKARDAKAASIEVQSKKIAIAVANPELPAAKELIRWLQSEGYVVKTFVVSLSSLGVVWGFYKFVKPETEQITGKMSITNKGLRN